ncbi:MAG: hypothetical protein DCC75_03240, partial [Proteobacteria bacterium]
SAEASYVACKFALCSPRHRQIAEVQGLTAFANALMSTAPVAVCENKARSVVTVPDAQWTTRNGQDYFLTHIHCADGNPFKEWMAYLGFNLWVANLSAVGGDGPNPVPNLVASYISLIRSNILGSLETLLEVLVFNSAVGRYLDLFDNHYVNGVINGNENWARELLELFSVRPSNPLSGDSNYTENDVVRCFSRSFSGFVLSPDGTTSWDSSKWDPNMKTCFDGKPFQETAVFNYESLLPKLLRTHPETARSWVMQMYSFMIGKQPTMAMVDELAADLVNNNFDTRQVLTKIIRSNDTFSPSAQNRYVQNPLEVLMRLFRAFNLPLSNQAGADMYTLILDILESSGQPLFQPPTVFGFDERKNRGAGFSIGEIWAPMGRQLEFMRGLTRILDTLEAQGFAWTSIMPSQNASPRQLIDHCASKLGVQLSEPQKIILENYLTSILPNGSSTPVNIGWNPAAPNFQAQLKLKLPGLLYSLLTGINQIRTM